MRHVSIAAIPLLLSSCAVGPDFVRPDAPKIQRYTRQEEPSATGPAAGVAQRFEAGANVPEEWWRLFNAPKLDLIVTQAMTGNQTLQAALSSLRQSQQNLLAGEGVFYPQLNASFGATRERSNPSSFGVNVPPSIFNLLTLSSTVSYVLDIFGGARRAYEGLRAQVDLSRYTVAATYLTLTGNIVNAVIARAAYEAEIEAVQEIIRSEREEVALTEANVKGGTLPYANLLSLRSQLASTEATLPPLAQRLDLTDHLLAALSGKMPVERTPPTVGLAELKLPDRLPRSLPSELVRRRPDILQAEAQLHVASAEIGVATAALFPSFTLSGAFGVLNTSAGSLFSGRSSFWNFGADITAPLFRGGTLRAQRRAAIEAFNASLAIYRQTVLGGIQQVADVLRALEHDAELVRAQSDALGAANEALRVIQANYQAGRASYLQLLAADAQYFQARIGYLQAVAQRYQDTVAFFIALGGGWWNSPDPLGFKAAPRSGGPGRPK